MWCLAYPVRGWGSPGGKRSARILRDERWRFAPWSRPPHDLDHCEARAGGPLQGFLPGTPTPGPGRGFSPLGGGWVRERPPNQTRSLSAARSLCARGAASFFGPSSILVRVPNLRQTWARKRRALCPPAVAEWCGGHLCGSRRPSLRTARRESWTASFLAGRGARRLPNRGVVRGGGGERGREPGAGRMVAPFLGERGWSPAIGAKRHAFNPLYQR